MLNWPYLRRLAVVSSALTCPRLGKNATLQGCCMAMSMGILGAGAMLISIAMCRRRR